MEVGTTVGNWTNVYFDDWKSAGIGHEPSGLGVVFAESFVVPLRPTVSSTILFSNGGIHRRNDSSAPVFRLNIGIHGGLFSIIS